MVASSNTRFIFRLTGIAVALFAVSALPGLGDEAAPEVIFTYSPPTPLTYTETTLTRRTIVAGGAPDISEESTASTRLSLRKEGAGYVISSAPVSHEMKRDGKVVNDAVLDVIQDTRVTYHLDAEGRLKAIDGYAGVLEAAQKVAPKDAKNLLYPLMNEAALVERESVQWNTRIGQLLGQKGKPGSVWIGESAFAMPDGALARYYVITYLDSFVEQDGKKLARLRLLFTNDRDRIRQKLSDFIRADVPVVPEIRYLPAVKGFTIDGSGERLIDPSTMLIYSEKASRNVSWLVKTGKDTQSPVLVQEYRESSVSYATPNANPVKQS
ncbi:MAG: hypothetical protein IT209_05400 [Armatimonadetes bacterium]|nr:hypothetical protein [Armatimonadota bacterium]